MKELFKLIQNKETFVEILNNSVDYLIGYQNEEQLQKQHNKYNFHSEDDFLKVIKVLAQIQRNACINDATESEFRLEFTDFHEDWQKLAWSNYKGRYEEIYKFFLRAHNAQDFPLVETFDWDLRYIMGDSNFPDNRHLLVNVSLHCQLPNGKRDIVQFQANEEKLDELINELEKAYNK